MVQAICPKCGLSKKLIQSHSIPKAFYDAQKSIYIPVGGTAKVARTVITGKHPILCSKCDQRLGSELDKPAFEWVTKTHALGALIADITLARFLASVFWRASQSEHNYYRSFLSPDHELAELLKAATYDEMQTFQIASYDVRRIEENEVFSREELDSLILHPVVRPVDTNLNSSFISLRAVFGGCIWTMLWPKLTPRVSGLLHPDGHRCELKTVRLEDDPELSSFIVSTLEKFWRGEISHKLGR